MGWFDQIPRNAIKIGKYTHCSVIFDTWFADNCNIIGAKMFKIEHKIIGLQKRKNTATGLISDPADLLFVCGFCD